WGMGMREGSLSVKAAINLYQALVRSVLEYGVWGEGEEGERVQREMGRRILRCHGKTCNEAVQGELGWWTLTGRLDFLRLKYWIRLCLLGEKRMVRQVYLVSRREYFQKGKQNWCAGMHKLIIKYELQAIWLNEQLIKEPVDLNPAQRTTAALRSYWAEFLAKKVQEVEERNWRKAMELKPKLRTYKTIKAKIRLENYLISEKDKPGRYLLTRLRTGTNKLRIETGRWKRPIERPQERVCEECKSGQIEDERHFVIECERYQDLRGTMFQQISSASGIPMATLSMENQWTVLMSDAIKPSSKTNDALKLFVRKALKRRIQE